MRAVERRQILRALSAAPLCALLPTGVGADTPSARVFASARQAGANNALISGEVDAPASVISPLPDRGHAVSLAPDGRLAVICARRPGRFAVAFDPVTLEVLHRFQTPDDRHFCGHGAFSRDGRRFYTTENAFDVGEGRIGLYDPGDGFRRLGEWTSHGVGPHEIARMPGGDDLVVAIGGIRTHPATGRAKLNIDTMEPSIAVLDGRDGRLLRRLTLSPALHQLSLRHIALTRHGQIAVGGQWEGPEDEHPPPISIATPETELAPVDLPADTTIGLANYIGSIGMCGGDRFIGATAPRGDRAVILSGGDRPELISEVSLADVGGIAPGPATGDFFLSDGFGGLTDLHVDADGSITSSTSTSPGIAWDNHLAAIHG